MICVLNGEVVAIPDQLVENVSYFNLVLKRTGSMKVSEIVLPRLMVSSTLFVFSVTTVKTKCPFNSFQAYHRTPENASSTV